MTLLIDADWLIYNSCCACEQDTRWNDWEHTLYSNRLEILNMIDNRLDVYRTIADSKHDIVMCFTSYPTFRHEIFPEYKINRIGKRKPLALKSVIKEVKEKYETVAYENLEGEQRRETDKLITETIGTYDDFMLTIVATAKNLEDLLETKPTQRGRLLTKFIGLEIIEKKEAE